jgi:hypothetical protein
MRYAVELAYDGRPYSGWQRQPGRKTVQGDLEDALSVLEGARVRCVGAGRTDKGVHARGQVVSFDLTRKWEAGRLLQAIDKNLPPEVGIKRPLRCNLERVCLFPLDGPLLFSAGQALRLEGSGRLVLAGFGFGMQSPGRDP